jgi:hypothetical protein
MGFMSPRRPSTFYNAPARRRNFYTDREKLVGKHLPAEDSPHGRPCFSTFDLHDQVLSRIAESFSAIAALVRFPSGLDANPLHDGSKSTKVDTVWSMRHAGCTNLGNRGPSRKCFAQPDSGPL